MNKQNKRGVLSLFSHIRIADIVPFIAFIAVFVFFAIASDGIMVSSYNLKLLVNQSLVTIIVGCGALFVVAQGSIDLSVGVNLAFSAVISAHLSIVTGSALLFIPVMLIVSTGIGLLNGIIVSKFKVASFMTTIAMLIGLRGVINYIQTIVGPERSPEAFKILAQDNVRFPLFFIIVIVMAYLFEYTKLGKYSKAIGENETVAKFVGIPVTKMKILAFVISGLLTGVGSLFSVTTLGGTSQTMGVFFEMQVAMAIYFGGVLVTGGTSARIYKVVLGSLTITTIVNGLAIIGKAESQISESVEGILLLVILFVTILANISKSSKKKGVNHEQI
ncbi:MAG: ABC transporter permease [Clostridiales Family XIII bacterium]|nr:ABC transporter permease [Clostridiales Family XIII bacterium]